MESIKNKVLEEYKKGNIVVAGIEGLQIMPIKEFIKQPVDGMLYDLNRSEAVVLTFIDDPKWINDYAVAKVIRELKKELTKIREDFEIKLKNDIEDGSKTAICQDYKECGGKNVTNTRKANTINKRC